MGIEHAAAADGEHRRERAQHEAIARAHCDRGLEAQLREVRRAGRKFLRVEHDDVSKRLFGAAEESHALRLESLGHRREVAILHVDEMTRHE